jgi:hypothetical protein
VDQWLQQEDQKATIESAKTVRNERQGKVITGKFKKSRPESLSINTQIE